MLIAFCNLVLFPIIFNYTFQEVSWNGIVQGGWKVGKEGKKIFLPCTLVYKETNKIDTDTTADGFLECLNKYKSNKRI